MTAENINNDLIANFLDNLPSSVPSSRIAVMNIQRGLPIKSLLYETHQAESGFINTEAKDPSEIKDELVRNIASKKYVFIHFVGYLSPEIYLILEEINKNGWIDIKKAGDGVPDRTLLPEDSHIILVSERKFIEGQYGNLNNLTTYILDLENE